MKKELILKRYPYCNINNTLIKEKVYKYNDIDEFINYIEQSYMYQDDKLFYGEYFIDVNMAMSLEEIKKDIENTIVKIQEYERGIIMDNVMVKIFLEDEWKELHNLKDLESKNIRDVCIGNNNGNLGIKFELVSGDMFKIKYGKYLENEINNKIKPIRGLRRDTGVIEEVCDMNKKDIEEDLILPTYMGTFKEKENNIYLSQKERNTIRTQIENVLHKFEGYVDDHLYKNELESAKADHNVVMVARNILSKLDIVDCSELKTYDYYLTIGLNKDGENKAILFKRYENSLKIEKFVSFYEQDCRSIVRKFLEEIKELTNCAILIPTVGCGGVIVSYFKQEGFEDIIEVNPRDMYNAMCPNDLYIGANCDESYIRSLFYTTSKLGLKL